MRHCYGYDENDQERVRTGGGSTIGTALNAEGLVTQTTESTSGTGPYTNTFGYTPNDLLSSVTMGDPVQQSIAYDKSDRVTGVTTTGARGIPPFGYGYNSLGQVTSVTTLSGTDTLSYDSLQSEAGPHVLPSSASHTCQWTCNPNGNITSATADNGNTAVYTYSNTQPNELVASSAAMDPTTSFFYDSSGNTAGITTTTTPLTSSLAISYDSQSRPLIITHKDADDSDSTNTTVVFDTITLAYNARPTP